MLDFDATLLERVRDLIEHIPSFPEAVATPLLTALGPLLRHKVHLRNALILTMRKAMFKRDAPSRTIAIVGLCAVLECAMHANNARPIYLTQHPNSKSNHHASQVPISQSQSVVDMDNLDVEQGNVVSVFRQFSSLFRKALTCQRPVRETLYVHMKRMVKQCPGLCGIVMDLLVPHLQPCIEPNEALSPPLYLKEDDSIPLLLDAVLACDGNFAVSVMERMKHVEMEDFELDKTSIAVEGSPTHARAKDVVTLCEVALNHIWELETDSPVLSLEQRMHGLKLIEVRHKVTLLIKAHQAAQQPSGSLKRSKGDKTSGDRTGKPTALSNRTIGDGSIYCVHHRSLLIVLQSMVRQVDSNLNDPMVQQCILELTHRFMRQWLDQKSLTWLQAKKSSTMFRLSPRMQLEFLTELVALLWKASEEILAGHAVAQPPTSVSMAAAKKKRQATNSSAKAQVTESLQSVAYVVIGMIFDATAPQIDVLLRAMLIDGDRVANQATAESLGLELQKKVFGLIRNDQTVEAHLLFRLLTTHVFPTYSVEMTERARKWMEAVCSSQSMVSYLPLVMLFVQSLLKLPANWLRFACAIRRFLCAEDGGDNPDDLQGQPNAEPTLACMTVKTMDEAVETTLYNQLTLVAECCAPLMSTSFPNHTITSRVIRTMVRLYKVSTAIVQRQLRSKYDKMHVYSRAFLDATSRHLTPLVLQFIACNHEENKRKAAVTPRSSKKPKKLHPDAKLIPDLIYQVEQYDVVIIKLSKLCKNVNFTRWCVRRQARDFKLNPDKVSRIILPALDHDQQNDGGSENEAGGAPFHLGGRRTTSQAEGVYHDDVPDQKTGDDEVVEDTEDEDASKDIENLYSGEDNDTNDDDDDDDVPATARQEDNADDGEDEEMTSRHVKRRRQVVMDD
ncbi:hypothetical protein DYB32_002989 [Aphanomyces invadans]|uniref:FANCI solenoid 4 domain-containing protein n=1 Tax=Aphanomyces invadans TaxID=157072 RepID=A0A3R6VDX1_9STRA|nr:hypothetical protein DYB32_002989 [Aphanomyces invadans]